MKLDVLGRTSTICMRDINNSYISVRNPEGTGHLGGLGVGSRIIKCVPIITEIG
jgi:hypothetical protein